MELVGRLFCTSRSLSHGSTSSAPTYEVGTVYSSIEQGKLLIETIPPAPASPTSAPQVPMPKATFAAPPMSPTVPPVAPTTSEPSITISASEFRGLIQQHLGFLPSPHPNLPASSEPLAPAKDTILVEDTTTTEVQIPPLKEATIDVIASIDP
ncbi:hypothetical protein CK203_087194 [Vitis vinifera]|uniref:Uncharacterized protein n=1 Tax=Vitis vinifera TaxID=29760 RepID=A0A438BRZ1_VITVI|nr:hypothetical protein CK203_087194 [Vitis vinifera]